MSSLGVTENHKIQKRPVVLIIDDDVDAIISLEKTVKNLGCDTLTALDAADAQKKLMAGKVDLVILDWCLDHNLEAGQILEKVARVLRKFSKQDQDQDSDSGQKKIYFVTHSSLAENQFKIPTSEFFTRIEHWQKPIHRNDLVKKTTDVLKVIGF